MLRVLFLVVLVAVGLAGCVVVPARYAYAPGPVVYATPVAAAPVVGVGVRIR
ncbi:hypothetical protein [Paraburkholderia humisilvae]|uniref:Lipoprotein n=1 Tax=Paraburkholderia humisilvae TaxID=627669 RepID=A0A6J5DM56_9BURK|nr:hypothetical protein [Paraburkholderia humisilvae]CAB3754567.1 hypothetical protein LMG29542_02385 [Paraburkholderia humisilvae]